MPHLLIRGVPAERLQAASPSLVRQLAELCACGTDNFTVNCLHATSVYGGGPDEPPFAFVEVGWFERGQDIRNRFAAIVTRSLMDLDIPEVEVVFQAYREDGYYINGTVVSG